MKNQRVYQPRDILFTSTIDPHEIERSLLGVKSKVLSGYSLVGWEFATLEIFYFL